MDDCRALSGAFARKRYSIVRFGRRPAQATLFGVDPARELFEATAAHGVVGSVPVLFDSRFVNQCVQIVDGVKDGCKFGIWIAPKVFEQSTSQPICNLIPIAESYAVAPSASLQIRQLPGSSLRI